MCFVDSYLLQLPQIISKGLSTYHAHVKLVCLFCDIHFEHIRIFCDLCLSSSPDIQLEHSMQIPQNYVDIWKIQQEFLDMAHGRSWQNFSKSEQEKLSGKLDSANFNFRLPPSNAFATLPPPTSHLLSSFFCCSWGAHLRSRSFHYHNHLFPPLVVVL